MPSWVMTIYPVTILFLITSSFYSHTGKSAIVDFLRKSGKTVHRVSLSEKVRA